MLHKSLFTINGIEAIFEGYTDGSDRYGFVYPWFTKEVADEIMRVANKKGKDMRYRKDADAYALFVNNEIDEYCVGQDIDGLHLYLIGAACWIWHDTANYLNERGKMLMSHLQEEYSWLNCEQLYEVYFGIVRGINTDMTNQQIKIFADGFMAAYKKQQRSKTI